MVKSKNKMSENIEILNTFELKNIPDLDVAVLGALELFKDRGVEAIDLSMYKRPLVVGSGNAEITGRIIFEKADAVFASESNFEDKLKNIKDIDGVVVVSASGEKHAPIIVRTAKKYGKHITLITNNENSSAIRELDSNSSHNKFIFPKNREPYTYNTSTYLGIVLGHTKEDPSLIYQFIKNNLDDNLFSNLSNYDKFFLIVPPKFSSVVRMLEVKFIELFGRNIARDIETSEYMKHAVTVAPANELFISFGEKNENWGQPENRLHIPLPEDANYAAMIAIGYYTIAQIQKIYPHYFKENIDAWAENASKIFGSKISPIVD